MRPGRVRRIAGRPLAAAPTPPHPLNQGIRIAWTTDTHYKQTVGNDPNAPGAIVNTRYYFTFPDKMNSFVRHVNTTTPHAVLATGDLIEGGTDFATWRTYWDAITAPGITKLWVPGNHDFIYTPSAGTSRMDATASYMGVLGNPLVGGSRFNQSLSISNGTFSVRVILWDSNISASGDDASDVVGYCRPTTLSWIESELTNCPETVALLASHHGPHLWSGDVQFNYAQARSLQDVVEGVKTARPGMSITAIFGHNHIQNRLSVYSNLGSKFLGYLSPALIELAHASATDLYVFSDGSLWWSLFDLQYPFVP